MDTIKETEMKENIRKDYFKTARKLLKTRLCSRNFIKWINTGGSPNSKILKIILKIDQRKTQTNGQEN